MSELRKITIVGTIEFDPAVTSPRAVTKVFDDMVTQMLAAPHDTAWPDEVLSPEHGSPGVGHFRATRLVKPRKPKRKKR